MNNSEKNILRRASLWLVALLFMQAGYALAQPKLSVSDFSVQAGGEQEIAINFDDAGNSIVNLQADFTLPEGLTYVGFRNNEDRIERGVHTASVNQLADGSYRLTVLQSIREAIPGGDGALVYLTVRAAESFATPAQISFDAIHAGDLNSSVRYDQDPFTVHVSPDAGSADLSVHEFTIRPGRTQRIEVTLQNKVTVYGLSGRLTLPEGLSWVKNDRGRISIEYGSRLPQDAVVTVNEQTGKFTVTSMAGGDFGSEGLLFAFDVVADETLPAQSEIVFGEVEVSGEKDMVFQVSGEVHTAVTNAKTVYYDPSVATLDALQAKLDEAAASLAETAPDVKDNEELVAAQTAIQSAIDQLRAALQAAYEADTLPAEMAEIMAPAPALEADIDSLLADAAAAQAAFVANNAAYERLTADVAKVQGELDTALATIAETCADVAADFPGTEIQSSLDALSADLQGKHEAGELTAESSCDDTLAEISAAVAALLADAQAAQAAFVANNAAYERLTADVAKVQGELDTALATIAETCADVAADFPGTEIQSSLDALSADLQGKHEAGELTAESSCDDTLAEISAAVAALLADAQAAQEKYNQDTGIGCVVAADGKAVLYNLQGVRELHPVKGRVYILMTADGKSKKVRL